MTDPTEDQGSPGWSFKNVLDKHPNQIVVAFQACLNVPIVSGALTWSTPTVAAVNVALGAVLQLFVSSKTANKATLEEMGSADPAGG